MLKPLTVWITTNWKILKEMGVPDHFTCLLRNLYADQEATVRSGHGTKLGTEYDKAVYCYSVYLTHMQNKSCEMLGWHHKLESDCWEKHEYPQICRWYHTVAEIEEELKSLLMRVRKESEKAGWKLNNQKLRLWHLVLSLHANINRGKSGSNNTFYFLGLQNHCGWWLQPGNVKTPAS